MSIFSNIHGTALAVIPPPEPNLAAVPEAVSEHGMSVGQLVAILLAYWMQIAALTVAMGFLATTAIKYVPKTYTATTTLLVDTAVKDPLAGRNFPEELISNYLSTQIELMTSPIVLLPVLHKLDLMHDPTFGGRVNTTSPAIEANVEDKLEAAIDVKKGVGGQLLYLSASARSAAKSAAIANAVADVYLDEDRQRLNDPANVRAQRYSQELAALREKASVAQQKVTAFGKENGIDDINSNSAGLEVQTLDSLREHLLNTQNYRRSLEANQTPASSAATATHTTQASLDTQLWQLSQLRKTYGPEHPKVQELSAQIALTRQTLANESAEVSANTAADLSQTRQLEQKYLQDIAAQEVKVAKVRQAQADGSKLILELESAKATYKQALDGYDQIMFQAVANHTNVSIVDRAVAPLEPSKPNKLKLTAVAILGSIAFGFAVPLGFGLFVARRLRCRDDMERDFGIAVLAQLTTVPALRRAA